MTLACGSDYHLPRPAGEGLGGGRSEWDAVMPAVGEGCRETALTLPSPAEREREKDGCCESAVTLPSPAERERGKDTL